MRMGPNLRKEWRDVGVGLFGMVLFFWGLMIMAEGYVVPNIKLTPSMPTVPEQSIFPEELRPCGGLNVPSGTYVIVVGDPLHTRLCIDGQWVVVSDKKTP